MGLNGQPKPTPPDPIRNDLVVQALCRGPLEIGVTVVGAAATRDGTAHIVIRYGKVLIYVEDREAIERLSRVVRRAHERADEVFGPVEDEFSRAERRARNKIDRTGQSPSQRTG